MGENNPSRRKVLKSVSAVGFSSAAALSHGGLTGKAAAAEASKIDVRKVTGRERQKAIQVARSHSHFHRLRKEVGEYIVQIGKASARHVTEKNGDTRYVVLFPLKRTGKPDAAPGGPQVESYLIYNGVETVSDQLTEHDVPTVSLYEVDTSGGSEDVITKFTVENGEVVSGQAETQLRQQQPSQQSFGTAGCDTCYKSDISCSQINYGCALLVAGMFVTAFTACAVCVGSAGWIIPACGYCLGAILGTAGTIITCDVGDCTVTSSCVPESKCYRYCNYIGCTF